ncbi:MAG TPA: RNA polymerase sigma factor, partial [Acidimicrobiales bacterium]|nr:RNA polymerase sigma factor [Acidimicrobiales bacterium]
MAVRADDVDLIRDRSLVESCQAGDTAAFADLYERYYQRLYRFCLRRVHSQHEAEEIAQEAFARAFTAMPRFAGERRFYPWLTVIAGRLCVDSHRRSARTEPSAEVDLGETEGGQQSVIDDVDRQLLNTALQNLGPRHREVLDLRETQGWSYQQIADHYDVTMGTVEALLFRARKALRREFVAVAGEGGRLAALPILGVAMARLADWRIRVQHWADHATPAAAAASAAAVVALVGGVAAV